MENGAKLKICVYAISKNEEKFVKRFCESAKDADLIVIADTGSTDSTIALARECGADVHQICITPWRFDKARDAALALVPGDVDVCVSIDLDEVLEPGWREEVEKVWVEGTTRLRYEYAWGHDINFTTDKIHGRKGYFWHHPCHEQLRLDPRVTQVYAETPKLLVTHKPDPDKSRGTYLELLAMSVKEDPTCSRNAFYYARELYFYGKFDESIQECERFLGLPNAVWHHERCFAMRVIGKCFEAKGMDTEAEKWFFRAAAEAPETREPWCALVTMRYRQQRWAECYAAAKKATSINSRELVYTSDPACWKELPWDIGSIAAWNLGMKEEALHLAKVALTLAPHDPRIAENIRMMVSATQVNNLPVALPDDIDSFVAPS